MRERQERRGFRPAVGLVAAATLALAISAVLSGCGSVADVGLGAGQSGVQPVSGAYGSTGYYPTTATGDQDKQVASIARGNDVSQSKAAAAPAKTEKQQPDTPTEIVPDAQVETVPPFDPALKTVVITQDQTPAPPSMTTPMPGSPPSAYGSPPIFGSPPIYGPGSPG